MAKPIEYLSGARIDFDESFDWYAERSIGAAIGFASAVDDALEAIVEDPDRFPNVPGSCAYCALARYPFRIVWLVAINVQHPLSGSAQNSGISGDSPVADFFG